MGGPLEELRRRERGEAGEGRERVDGEGGFEAGGRRVPRQGQCRAVSVVRKCRHRRGGKEDIRISSWQALMHPSYMPWWREDSV